MVNGRRMLLVKKSTGNAKREFEHSLAFHLLHQMKGAEKPSNSELMRKTTLGLAQYPLAGTVIHAENYSILVVR